MRLSLRILALPAFVGAALSAPVLAAPQASDTPVEVRVAFGDLDVTTAEGRAALARRIDAQARAACTIPVQSRYVFNKRVVDQDCVAEVRGEALAAADRIAAARAANSPKVAAN